MKQPKTYLVDEYGRHYELIKGYIPENYSIWNAGLLIINNSYYLKLYATNEVKDYTVNINSLKCIRVNKKDALKINSCISGGRNPLELCKALNSNDQWIKNKALEIKPYILKLFNIKQLEAL